MKRLKIGLLVVGLILVGALLTLRVTGLPPGKPSAEEYFNAGRSARPGLWLTGEVVKEPVTNWDWVDQYGDASPKTQPNLRPVPGTESLTLSPSCWFPVESNSI